MLYAIRGPRRVLSSSGLLVRMRRQCWPGGFSITRMAFSRATTMSSIALSMAPISRTLVESTWLKMLRYQCTTGSLKKWPAHPLYAAISRIMATVKAGAPVRCEEPRMGSSRRSSAEEDCGRQVPHYARGWSNGAMFGLSSLHRLPPRT